MPFIKIPQRVLVHPKVGMPYYSTRSKRIFTSGDSAAQHLRFQDLAFKSLKGVDYAPILEKLKSNFADSLFTKTFISLQVGQEEGKLLVNTRTNTLVALIVTSGDKKIVHSPMVTDDRDLQTIKSFVQTRLGNEESAVQKFQAFIEKLQPPRPGLVPQTGDYEHPFRWVRPPEKFGDKILGREQIDDFNLLLVGPNLSRLISNNLKERIEKVFLNIEGTIKLFAFLDGYAKIALGEASNEEIDFVWKQAVKISNKGAREYGHEKVPWIQESLDKPTRLNKIIAIDSVISEEHISGISALPQFFRTFGEYPDASRFDRHSKQTKIIIAIYDELSGEMSPKLLDKSFVEIKKAARSGLVPKVVPIEREGKMFRGIRWVRPGEDLKTPTGVRIPPAWKDVWITIKKDNPLQAFGKDSKGRTQYLYSKKHSEKAASKKFSRAKVFAKTLPSIMKQVQKDLPKHEEALVLYLIYKTGFRIGKEGETLAAKKAYGASTLLPEHVTVNGDEVNFNFVGKKGVQINKTVEDAILAEELNKRLKGKEGKIFDVEYTDILDYLRNISGKSFNIKDFRTWMGTSVALEKIKTMRAPASEKEFKQFRREVGQEVALELGNTYAVALSAYVNPEIFSQWLAKLEEEGITIKKEDNEWQTLDDMFETVQYDEPESEEIEEEPEIDDELSEKYWDYEENGYLQKFQDLFEKSRVAYHEHEGWQEHPVRVGDHQKYFSGEDNRSIERTPEKQWPILISTKKIPEESIKKVFSEIPQKWQDLIYEDPTPLEVKENTRTNGGLYSGHVISINPILFLFGPAKVESTYPGAKGDNFGEIVLLHEFAHAIFFSLVENDYLRKDWADASREYGNWKEKGQLITKYSSEGAHEFFAECVVYYLRAPKILKQVHPTVFSFFDKYFSKQQIEKQDKNNEEFEPGLGAWWFETEEGFDKLFEENKDLENGIEKGIRTGLVARKVKVYPEKGNDYWATRWVRPEKGFEEYEKLLSVDEKRALTNYKQFNALLLNNFLRGGYKEGKIADLSKIPDWLKEKAKEAQEKGFFYQQEMNLMDSAFDKVPPLENDTIVYRGIRKVTFENKLGKIFVDPAYVSVTSDINIAKRFGDVVKIKLSKGAKIIPMDPLGPLVMQKEKEFLLPRNKKFTVAKDENDEIMLELHNE